MRGARVALAGFRSLDRSHCDRWRVVHADPALPSVRCEPCVRALLEVERVIEQISIHLQVLKLELDRFYLGANPMVVQTSDPLLEALCRSIELHLETSHPRRHRS